MSAAAITRETNMMRKVWFNAEAAATESPPAEAPAVDTPRWVDTTPNTRGATPVDIDTSVVRTASAVPHKRECTMSSIAALSCEYRPPNAITPRKEHSTADG